MSKIPPFIGMAISLVVAIGCDRWLELLKRKLSQNFNLSAFYWQIGIANLLLAIVFILLAWFVLFRSKRSRLVSTGFLLVGLLVTFASALQLTFTSTFPPPGIMEFLTPGSHVLSTAAFWTALGIAGFIFHRHTTSETVSDRHPAN